MADKRKALGAKFVRKNRYPNFGPVINRMDINGFRGIDASIEFGYPVTALTGLNGAGKSTVGQLALCAYRKIQTTSQKRFYVKDFFPVSPADPAPFLDDASVTFRYQTDSANTDQFVTVTRAIKEWSGYKRQPERTAIYLGLAFYLPKVERKDLTIYAAKNITLTDRQDIENGATWVSRILGGKYDEIYFQGVESQARSGELGMASRFGSIYSENNMGFGEGRVVHAIRLLESCPEQSCVVLEEPETSLHEFAQYEFTKYLMDVSFRRGHQIIFSTHSSVMLGALPPEGRKMLARDKDGVSVHDRLSSSQVRNALSDGHEGHLIVCVEDTFAQSFLREIVRGKNLQLLQSMRIIDFGDTNAVAEAVKVLRKSGVRAIGVRDGDQPKIEENYLFTLPGPDAPEKLIFLSQQGKKTLARNFGFDIDAHMVANPELDHHEYSKIVARKTGFSREVIESDCIRAFIEAQDKAWCDELISTIGGFV